MRILIVDDHPLVREGVRTLINHQSGLEVVGEAADADSALEAIARLTASITPANSAARMRGGDMGICCIRTPTALETALATAASGGTMEVSPTPRTP